MNVTLRGGKPDDVEACGQICYEAFKNISTQHKFPPDFPNPGAAVGLMSFLFSRREIYSVVAEADGRVVGSNFLWEYPLIAGVGPITVDPEVQNVALGKSLMLDVLHRARDKRFAGVRLVQAAYHSRSLSLYTKLGFDTREPLSLVQGPAIGLEITGHSVRLASETDLDRCNELCLKVHGHDRGPELLSAIKEGTASLVEREGRVTGYATLVGFFGHAVGENNDDMKALISGAKTFAGSGFLLPTRNSNLLRWCLANGLRVIQPMTLMSLGLYNEPAGAFLPSIIY